MKVRHIIPVILMMTVTYSCNQKDTLKDNFRNPPNEFRPMPFWHLNGHLTKEGIEKQITGAKTISGFGGLAVLPVSPARRWTDEVPCPGMTPEYLSEDYFDRYSDMLEVSKSQNTEIILYDDINFPSGSAGGRFQKEYPKYTRKKMVKEEFPVKGPGKIKLSPSDTSWLLMAVSAMNIATLEVADLAGYMKNRQLEWNVPPGAWRVMFFCCKYNVDRHVDYMQPEGVKELIKMTYDEYAKRFEKYFGNVITKTFYDDVGFVHNEEVWTPAITDIFREKYGKNPALYYPALYYDIGPETQAARVAFYDIRSELMAEGYVRQVAEWSARHNLKSMGHPPENYSPNTVVAHGDVLKYYRHTQIPLLDAIFFYGRGLHGFKQISSAADLGDKPVVGAELCGAFPADMDSLTLFRVAMEAMTRGVNFVVPHGMWYDVDPAHVRIPPLISHESPILGPCLPRYSMYVARSCMMLQGGRRVSDIALLSPIAAIQGESYINRDTHSGLPVANWVPGNVVHHQLSDLLTNQLRRDFTFVHPEDLCNGKISIDGDELKLNNTVNIQHYKVLMLTGGDVISVATLEAVKKFYDAGGRVIATASLPFKSAEFGQDQAVRDLISGMTGIDPEKHVSESFLKTNPQGGQFAFIPAVDSKQLEDVFNRMNISADVRFDGNSLSGNKLGFLNYIHKQKDGRDIYFMTNSTDSNLSTTLCLRGKFRKLERWNPHTGEIVPVPEFGKKDGSVEVDISLPPVSSLFIIGYPN